MTVASHKVNQLAQVSHLCFATNHRWGTARGLALYAHHGFNAGHQSGQTCLRGGFHDRGHVLVCAWRLFRDTAHPFPPDQKAAFGEFIDQPAPMPRPGGWTGKPYPECASGIAHAPLDARQGSDIASLFPNLLIHFRNQRLAAKDHRNRIGPIGSIIQLNSDRRVNFESPTCMRQRLPARPPSPSL
jgi:hypothetical protein